MPYAGARVCVYMVTKKWEIIVVRTGVKRYKSEKFVRSSVYELGKEAATFL